MIVEVIVDLNNMSINKPFSYNVKKDLESLIEIGQRVYVEFGRRSIVGFVVNILDGYNEKLKTVNRLKDLKSNLNNELFKLCITIANSNVDSYSTVFKSALPTTLNKQTEKYFIESSKLNIPRNLIDNNELIKYDNDFIFTDDFIKKIKNNEVLLDLSINNDKYKRNERIVNIITENVKTPKQKKLLEIIKSGVVKYVELKELGYANILKTLVNNGHIYYSYEEKKQEYILTDSYSKVILNEGQKSIYDSIKAKLDVFNVHLIHGVTSSGKTEIYKELIHDVLKKGKKVIYLVPEIYLIHQTYLRLLDVSKRISIIHSRLTEKEQFTEYLKIINLETEIVLGTRSSIFMPLESVGLIIMDESHSHSYLQETTPTFSTKNAAIFRAKYNNCPLILGTATPSIDDYTQGKKGEYLLHNLDYRALGKSKPIIKIIDMKEEDNEIISNDLDFAIREALLNKEKVIIFHNRTGYSNFLLCKNCGDVKKCDCCNISLTYHKDENVLRCHYCGKEYRLTSCLCGTAYSYMGVGTEKLEELLSKKYNVKVLRLDSFINRKTKKTKEVLDEFSNNDPMILVGTSIISKGLDYDVKVVGVINPDTMLNFSSYNSAETTFQLLEQISGRSGRKSVTGNVYIQTYNPNNYIFKCLGDYRKFYNQEINYRKIGNYPPFSNLCLIEFKSNNYIKLKKYSETCAAYLRETISTINVVGPSQPVITKVNNKEVFQIIVKYTTEDLYSPLMNITNNKERDVSVKFIFDPTYI